MAAQPHPTRMQYPEDLHAELNTFTIGDLRPLCFASHADAAAFLTERAYGLSEALFYSLSDDDMPLPTPLARLALEGLSTLLAVGCYHAQRSERA